METGRTVDSRGRHLLRVGFVLVTLFTAGLVTSGVVAGAGPLAVLSDSTTTETTTKSGTTSTESTTESTTTDEETTSEETTAESTTTESETTTTEPETTDTESTPAPSGPPTIASDQADYSPGALVTLSGTNWQPGETVNIDVNDDVGQTWRRSVDVVADGSGEIVDRFNLADWFVATYRVVATGATSGTATTTFTDGDIRVRAGRTPSNTNTAVTIAADDLKLFASSDCSGASGSSNTNAFTTGGGGGNGYASPSPAMNAPSGTSFSIRSQPRPQSARRPTRSRAGFPTTHPRPFMSQRQAQRVASAPLPTARDRSRRTTSFKPIPRRRPLFPSTAAERLRPTRRATSPGRSSSARA